MLKKFVLGAVGILILMQFVPIGLDHTNPPITQEPAWDTAQTREIVKRTCFDCHSNETKWPWYSWVAPMRFLVAHDIEEAREHLNFSEWDRPQRHAHEAAEEIEEGEMPLPVYLFMHSEAKLTPTEKQQLIESFRKMFGDDES